MLDAFGDDKTASEKLINKVRWLIHSPEQKEKQNHLIVVSVAKQSDNN